MRKRVAKVRIEDLRDLRQLVFNIYWSDGNNFQINHKVVQLMEGLTAMIDGESVEICKKCKGELRDD